MKKSKLLCFLVLLLLGLGILLYPTISDLVNRSHGSYAIQQLQKLDMKQEEKKRQLEAARQYNVNLQNPTGEEPGEYDQILDFGDGVMGYIEIEKIDVSLPIYHGVEEDTLAKGIGHLPQSAFPIGGEGNHTVLTGHTGLPSAKLFTDLTKLENGDRFRITVMEEKREYIVDEIRVVLPSEAETLRAIPGEDLCTLVTCTPYGVNSHRLLVRGSRAEDIPPAAAPVVQETEAKKFPVVLLGCGILLLAGIFALVRKTRKKNG